MKNSTNLNILADYRNQANNTFLNFEGSEDIEGYDEFTDDYSANGIMPRGGVTKVAPVSRPYSIRVTKTSGGDTTVTLFNAADSIMEANFGNDANIVIESAIAGTSYRQMLWKLTQSQYRIGKTWIKCSNTDQLSEDLTITYNNFKGDVLTTTLSPALSEFQFITTQITIPDRINASSELKIVFTMLSSTSSMVFRFFPEVEINDVNALNGQAPAKPYAAPRLNQGPVFQIKPQTRAMLER